MLAPIRSAFGSGPYPAIFIKTERLGNAVRLGTVQHAAVVKHAGQAAHRIGTAAEAKQEYLVTGFVVLNDKAIAILNILDHAPP